jgi:hypothetical protein
MTGEAMRPADADTLPFDLGDDEPWTDPDHPDPVLDAAYRGGIVPREQRTMGDDGWDAITVLRARGRRLAKVIGHDDPEGAGFAVIANYDEAKYFDLAEIPVDGLDHLEDDLRRLLRQPDRGIVRGQIADAGRVTHVRRLLHPDGSDPASLIDVPRRWLALDVDGLGRPATIAAANLVACAGIAIAALPAEFHAARCLVQATASHGFKPGLRLRLWFWLDRPVSSAELKRWLPAGLVDHAVFSAAQIIYTAAPLFDGARDPLPVRLVRLQGTGCVTVPELPEPERPRPPPPVKPATGLSRYGEVTLDNAWRRIAGAREGERDRIINGTAYGVGQLAGAGVVPSNLALGVLHDAAAQIPGYSRRDASKVDRSFADGLRHPREVRP